MFTCLYTVVKTCKVYLFAVLKCLNLLLQTLVTICVDDSDSDESTEDEEWDD